MYLNDKMRNWHRIINGIFYLHIFFWMESTFRICCWSLPPWPHCPSHRQVLHTLSEHLNTSQTACWKKVFVAFGNSCCKSRISLRRIPCRLSWRSLSWSFMKSRNFCACLSHSSQRTFFFVSPSLLFHCAVPQTHTENPLYRPSAQGLLSPADVYNRPVIHTSAQEEELWQRYWIWLGLSAG